MSLIENQFKPQSTYPDENQGAAEVADLGGSDSPSTQSGTSLEGLNESQNASTKANIEEKAAQSEEAKQQNKTLKETISNSVNNAISQLSSLTDSSFLLAIGEDSLQKLKLDGIANKIKEAINSGTPISSVLKNELDSMLSNQLSKLQSDKQDTYKFLENMGSKFGANLKNKITGVLMSKIYIPEEVFLAGLKAIKPIKSNINYKDKYIRRMCFIHDFPKVLKFINNENNFKYTVENNTGEKEGIQAAKNGCWHVAKYIMGELYNEILYLKAIFPKPGNYDRNTDLDTKARLESTIKEYEAAKKFATPYAAIALQNQIDQAQNRINKLFINTEDKYIKCSDYKKINDLINKGTKQLYNICKQIIVSSYSNFTLSDLKKIIKRYDIHPSAFGTKDKEFGKKFVIKSGDINIIAPFITPKESITEEFKSIKDTQLFKNSVTRKYINPRNKNCKKIYVYLQSTNIHSKNGMYNVPYKERMEYPIYTDLIESLDNAASGFFKIGLGKDFVDALNSIEAAYYNYAKSVEDKLFTPAKAVYLNIADFTKIPELNESDYEDSTTSSSGTNGNGTTKPKASNPAGGTSVPSKMDPEVLDKSTDREENGVSIYKPKGMPSQGTDSTGHAIYGYPTDAEIQKAIANGTVGRRSKDNPYGFPITEKGSICPIIGYDANGRAIYGDPVFYPETKPISVDINGAPVFGYLNGKPIIGYTEDNEPILSEPRERDLFKRWEGTHTEAEVNSLSEECVTNILIYCFDYDENNLVDFTLADKRTALWYEYSNNNIFYGYDEDGNRIIEIDEDGQNIIGYDQYNYPKYGKPKLTPNGIDKTGKTVYTFTEDGQPVYGFSNNKGILGYNLNGSPIISDSKVLIPIGRTDDGYPVYKYDVFARSIIGFDENRNPVFGYVTYSVRQIESFEESELDKILKNSYAYTDETLEPYNLSEKIQLLKDKAINGIILLPVTGYDTNGNPTTGTPLLKEKDEVLVINLVIRNKRTASAKDYGYISNERSDYDLTDPTQLSELENIVMSEGEDSTSSGFILKIIFWEK